MRLLAFFMIFVGLGFGATETARITVPDSQAAAVASAVEAWIQGQKTRDGSPKFPGITAGS